MKGFELSRFSLPTEMLFGLDSSSQLGAEAKRLGAQKVLFVTDSGVRAAGILEGAFNSLREAEMPFQLFAEAPQDPDTQIVGRVARLAQEEGCDCIVVAGGGSALCTGKGAALMVTNPGNIRDYRGHERYQNPMLLCIGIPTTAGSGSEVSKNTILTDEETNRKFQVSGYSNCPRLAILDPLLVRSVPRSQAVASGVDALTHAIESYVSNEATPLTDAIALQAVEMMGRSFLPSVLSDDLDAKAEMLLASSMANVACGNAGLGLSHAMNGAITYFYKAFGYPPVAYGMIHAILLPHVMEFNRPVREAKLANLALALGEPEEGSQADLAERAVERVKEMLVALGAPQRLPWEGLTAQEVEEIVQVTVERPRPNPRKATREEMAMLVKRALQGWE